MDQRAAERPRLRGPHFRIQGKLVLAFGLELALVTGVAAAGLLGLRSANRSFETAIDHGLRVERLAGTMKEELLEARRSEDDFLLQWQSGTLDSAYQTYVRANQAHVAQLRATASELQAEGQARGLTERDSRAMADLVALQPYVNVYAEDFASAVALIGGRASRDARAQRLQLPGGRLAADAEVGNKIADFRSAAIVIEPLVADIARYGQENAAAEIVAAEAASRRTVVGVSIMFVAAIATGLGLASVLGHQIRTPLKRLVRAAEAVGAGDLTARAEISSQDEIGTLAAAFNGMTRQLRGFVVSLQQRVIERERAEQGLRDSQQLLQSIIDDLKRTKDALRNAHDELEVRVEDRTRELKSSNEQLQAEVLERERVEQELARSNAELEQFAYVASHDLQEPLRMVASYMQLLERRYKNKLDSNADEFIAFAVDGAKRMQSLINDLLTYARLTTRAKPFAPVDCDKIIDAAVDNLRIAIEESGAQIEHDPLPSVMADEMQLMLVFQNLISNAVKFRSVQAPRVRVRAKRAEGVWTFSVEDNGIGIEPQYREIIFGLCQRLHARTEYPGTGIGLTLCKKIVERHKGRIWVESELGRGATFYFTIPEQRSEKREARIE